MKITHKFPISTLLLCGLAACGGSGQDPIEDPNNDPVCTVDCEPIDGPITLSSSAISPSITSVTIDGRRDTFDDVINERQTGVLPLVGSAEYTGHMFASLEGDTPLANEIHGTISVDVNFFGDEITGDIQDLHTAMDGEPVERLGGSLEIDGEAGGTQGTFDADFVSNGVTGQINFEDVQALEISGTLDGVFRDVPNGNLFINTHDDAAAASGDVDLTIVGDTSVGAQGDFYVQEQ